MTLAIELKRGTSFFREAVSFSTDTNLEGVEVGVGIDLNPDRQHGGSVFLDEELGIVSLFEKPHMDKNGRPVPGEDGQKMSAIRAVSGYVEMADEPNGAKMLMTCPLDRSDANGKPVLTVVACADWTEAGRFKTASAWHDYVRTLSR